MKRIIIVLLVLMGSTNLIAHNQQIILLTIPKSGTYLLTQCLRLLGGNPIAYHLPYSKDQDIMLTQDNMIKFFIYRDPRDQLVSLVYWTGHLLNYTNFEDKLLHFIVNSSWAYDHIHLEVSTITDFYKSFMLWKNSSDVYTVRFEDLVGHLGGGSKEAQLREIRNIAKHAKITVSKSKIQEISEKLFGNSLTFREGQIGSWKRHFTPEVKKVFKMVAGQLLIDLGYEKDLTW